MEQKAVIPDTSLEARLSDLGERRIIDEVLRPRLDSQGVESFGDDCAHLAVVGDQIMGGTLVATTDPCPEPMASILGHKDFFYRGWLLATINLSDLAAAGARPVGLLTSLILPSSTTVRDLNRLLDGLDECCLECGTRVVGGNLKEALGDRLDITATAIGVCESAPLSRTGARAGDWIAIFGDLGSFWAGVLATRNNLPMAKETRQELLRNVLTPRPKVHLGRELAARGLLTACQDNSDGLYPTLFQLSQINRLSVDIDFSRALWTPEVQEVAEGLHINPVRLALGWGDWQLVGCGKAEHQDEVRELCNRHHIPVHFIGRLSDEEAPGVWMTHHGQKGRMIPLDSQRFVQDSWFTAGIDSYINDLLNQPLLD